MYREGVGVSEQETCAKADDEGVAIQWVSPARSEVCSSPVDMSGSIVSVMSPRF